MKRSFFLALILLFSGKLLSATGELPKADVVDFWSTEYAFAPQISPDGSRIVYERQYADHKTDQRYADLWLINFDGTGHERLTDGLGRNRMARWSPDGKRLVFVSDRDGQTAIYLLDLTDHALSQLTTLSDRPTDIAWSPDGSQLAFTDFVAKEDGQFALPKPPEGAKWAPPAQIITKLPYRFDKLGYFSPGNRHVFTICVDGESRRQITHEPLNHQGLPWYADTLIWSPDAGALFLTMSCSGQAENYFSQQLVEISLDDGAIRPITGFKQLAAFPTLASDGKTFAFVGFEDNGKSYQQLEVYTIQRDGSCHTNLTTWIDQSCYAPQWIHESKELLFYYDSEGLTHLCHRDEEGHCRIMVSYLGGNGRGYGGFGGSVGYSVASNGNFVCNINTPTMPSLLCVGNVYEEETRIVLHLNPTLSFEEAESFWCTSQADENRVQGWIIKPPNFDPDKKYPMILEVHGGPYANWGERFDLQKQLLARQGYVVAYANPRGSTGYGQSFVDLVDHNFPSSEHQDLMAVVDEAVSQGFIDPDRIYITGGSAGGILTCWTIAHTDRFCAATALYPIVNWTSGVLTTDIPHLMTPNWFSQFPWDDFASYWTRSPLSLVDHVSTPTLVMAGEEDWRTPVYEAEQYYQALKLCGVEAALVRFPQADHGIRRQPSQDLARISTILGWFDAVTPSEPPISDQ